MKKLEKADVFLHSFENVKYGRDFEILSDYFASNGLSFDEEFFQNPQNTLSYTVTLYFFVEGKNAFTIKKDNRREFLERKREIAAKLIKLEKYKKALKVLESLVEYAGFGMFEEDKPLFIADLLSGHLNSSLCHWKLRNWHKMKHSAEKSLKIDPINLKAVYRIAFADLKLLNFEIAIEFLAKETWKNCEEIASLKQTLMNEVKALREKEKLIYKNLLA